MLIFTPQQRVQAVRGNKRAVMSIDNDRPCFAQESLIPFALLLLLIRSNLKTMVSSGSYANGKLGKMSNNQNGNLRWFLP